jgi:hypothetical protein
MKLYNRLPGGGGALNDFKNFKIQVTILPLNNFLYN